MGRPLNASNKNKKFLLDKLKMMYGDQFDPIMRAAALADRIHKQIEERDVLAKETKDPAEKAELDQATTGLVLQAIDKWLKIGEFTNGKVSAITLSQDPENPLFDVQKIDTKMPHVEATQIYKNSLKPNTH